MNTVIEAMKARRSIRAYKPDMVPQELIDQVIEAGLWAPSGKNSQTPIIIKITNKEIISEMSKENCRIGGWAPDFDPFFGAPVVLLVLADKNWPTAVQDGSLVMGNMMIAAHTLGLGSCWVNRAKEEFEMPRWQEWLKSVGVEGEYIGVGHCVLGYPDVTEVKTPRRKGTRVYFAE